MDEDWYGRATVKRKNRGVAEIMQIIEAEIALSGVFAFNERLGAITFADDAPWRSGTAGKRWRDEDCTYLVRHLEMTHGPAFGWDITYKAVQAIASTHAFDPVHVYLESLTWDGKERLSSWLPKCLGTEDTEWTQAVGRAWMISAVARTYEPGCQVDHTLVLEGEQGAGKSTALRILGGEYFSDDLPDLHSVNAVMTSAGAWIMELAELAATKRSDQESIKSFLTRRVDKFRPPYGRTLVEWPRRSVFAASTNDQHWLHDDTGGRRFWPVRVGARKPPDLGLLERSRDQLWAEAVVCFKRKEKWCLQGESLAQEAVSQQERRRVADPWVERLRTKVEGRDAVTVVEAMEAMGLDIVKSTRGDAMRVGKALIQIGWTKTRPRTESVGQSAVSRPWVYVPPALDGAGE
jgi:putative DNA primase/helicase